MAGKIAFYAEIGEHANGKDLYFDEGEEPSPDGLYWGQRGPLTESFPEAEARAIMLAKTYKNVRISSRTTEVIAHIEE